MTTNKHPFIPSTITRRFGLASRFSAGALPALFFLALACPTFAAGPRLILDDGSQPISQLAVGEDLWVAAQDLPKRAPYRLLLLDSNGQRLLERVGKTSEIGQIERSRLWARTGIGGCGCGDLGEGYPFAWPAEASTLVGGTLEVRLVDRRSGQVLARRVLQVVERTTPLLHLTGKEGCPQQLYAVQEPVFFSSDIPLDDAVRVFLVPHLETWTIGDSLLDVRPGFAAGQLMPASLERLDELLAAPGELEPALYDIVWRPGGDPGLVLQAADRVLELPEVFSSDDRSDGGMVIDEWGCGAGSGLPGEP